MNKKMSDDDDDDDDDAEQRCGLKCVNGAQSSNGPETKVGI